MIITIDIFDLPPMPRNRSHMLTVANRRPMNIKTPLCRLFESDLTQRLHNYAKDFEAFVEAFDEKKHYISAQYIIYTPKSSLYTKDNRISSKSVDLDAHKTLQDTIFKSIKLDDKLIRETKYFSPVSHDEKWNYSITYRLENLCKLENMSLLTQSSIEQEKIDSMSFALL